MLSRSTGSGIASAFEATASAYGAIIHQHLVPNLGTLNVQAISYDIVQALVSKLTVDLSAKSVHNAITLLGVMLAGKKGLSAIKLGYIRHDPTIGLELPLLERRMIQPLTPEQVWSLVERAEEMAKEDPGAQVGHAAIFLDAFTGLRRGEMLALQYPDIDWFAREIIVRRSVSKVKARDGVHKWLWQVGPTKNSRSRRVGIGPRVLGFVTSLKQLAVNKEGFLLTPETAGLAGHCRPFIEPDYFDASIYGPIAAAAGMSSIRFHDLRHFFASTLIAQGQNAKYVCEQMGTLQHSGHFRHIRTPVPPIQTGGFNEDGRGDLRQAQTATGRRFGRRRAEKRRRREGQLMPTINGFWDLRGLPEWLRGPMSKPFITRSQLGSSDAGNFQRTAGDRIERHPRREKRPVLALPPHLVLDHAPHHHR